MRKLIPTIIIAISIAIPVWAQPPVTKLAHYAFDFPKYGYEITVVGTVSNFASKLSADDHININDEGYRIKTLIDRMSRRHRQAFISFFNDHCIGFQAQCRIMATGEIELNKRMQMIFRINAVKISSRGNEWSNRK